MITIFYWAMLRPLVCRVFGHRWRYMDGWGEWSKTSPIVGAPRYCTGCAAQDPVSAPPRWYAPWRPLDPGTLTYDVDYTTFPPTVSNVSRETSEKER